MTIAYVGLGSNVGDRLDHLRRAVAALDGPGISVRRVSSVYETDPVGPPQPDFLNAVCEVESTLSPRDLLAQLKEIEVALGRSPGERWGPREIDLDLLLYGNEVIEEQDMKVPHPEIDKRNFVAVPLLELAPELDLPNGRRLSVSKRRHSQGVGLFAPPEALLPR